MEHVLVHHGVLGMKWGVRRYQNEDGTLTKAGKERYSSGSTLSNISGARQTRSDINERKRLTNTLARNALIGKHVTPVKTSDGTWGYKYTPGGGGGSSGTAIIFQEDQLEELKDLVREELEEEGRDWEAKSIKQSKLRNVKTLVNDILNKAQKAAVKISEVASVAIASGKAAASKVLQTAVNFKDALVSLGGNALGAIHNTAVKAADKVRDSVKTVSKTSRLTDKDADKNLIKKLSKKWPY